MNTKDIEEIVKAQRPKLLPTEAEMDAYERRLITTLTQHHQAEVEKAVEAEREKIVEIIKDKGCTHKLYYSKDNIVPCYTKEVASILDALTPTKTDEQTEDTTSDK